MTKHPQNTDSNTVIAVLENKFNNLHDYMEKEFGGIKERQDKTNGSVVQNKEDIQKLRIKWAMLAGGWAVLCVLVFPLVIKVFGSINPQ